MKGSKGFLSKIERMAAVRKSIVEYGTYEHTFDELEHGAQVAWRNAPKCSNRKYWEQLKLIDCREVKSNEGMFKCCVQHISKAMVGLVFCLSPDIQKYFSKYSLSTLQNPQECGSSECYISVFPPASAGTRNGPRIWNDQLLSYASYEDGEKGVIGDPNNVSYHHQFNHISVRYTLNLSLVEKI